MAGMAFLDSPSIGFARPPPNVGVCLYTYRSGNLVLWVLVYVVVDDILIADNCPTLRARFVADISKRFPTEDKGELECILNTAITRDRAARTLNLSQGLYACPPRLFDPLGPAKYFFCCGLLSPQ